MPTAPPSRDAASVPSKSPPTFLEALAQSGAPLMLRDLSQRTNIAPAQAQRPDEPARAGPRRAGACRARHRLGRWRSTSASCGCARRRPDPPRPGGGGQALARTGRRWPSSSGSYGPTVIQVQEGPSPDPHQHEGGHRLFRHGNGERAGLRGVPAAGRDRTGRSRTSARRRSRPPASAAAPRGARPTSRRSAASATRPFPRPRFRA